LTKLRRTLPTLTEVVEVAAAEAAGAEPLPLAPESVPLEPAASPPSSSAAAGLPRLSVIGHEEAARIVDAVVARRQPQHEAWIREQVMQAVQQGAEAAVHEALRSHVDRAASDVARRLRSELPSLARAALDAVRPDGFES
jgi:hypothetical protein